MAQMTMEGPTSSSSRCFPSRRHPTPVPASTAKCITLLGCGRSALLNRRGLQHLGFWPQTGSAQLGTGSGPPVRWNCAMLAVRDRCAPPERWPACTWPGSRPYAVWAASADGSLFFTCLDGAAWSPVVLLLG